MTAVVDVTIAVMSTTMITITIINQIATVCVRQELQCSNFYRHVKVVQLVPRDEGA